MMKQTFILLFSCWWQEFARLEMECNLLIFSNIDDRKSA